MAQVSWLNEKWLQSYASLPQPLLEQYPTYCTLGAHPLIANTHISYSMHSTVNRIWPESTRDGIKVHGGITRTNLELSSVQPSCFQVVLLVLSLSQRQLDDFPFFLRVATTNNSGKKVSLFINSVSNEEMVKWSRWKRVSGCQPGPGRFSRMLADKIAKWKWGL